MRNFFNVNITLRTKLDLGVLSFEEVARRPEKLK